MKGLYRGSLIEITHQVALIYVFAMFKWTALSLLAAKPSYKWAFETLMHRLANSFDSSRLLLLDCQILQFFYALHFSKNTCHNIIRLLPHPTDDLLCALSELVWR